MPEFIFQMQDLRKVVPPKREILKGIWLSFFYGAKIGVLGHNGAGKSSLLRIMAGLDKDFSGEAFPAKGIKVGFLPQEPALNPEKTVLGNVEEGVAETKALLDRMRARGILRAGGMPDFTEDGHRRAERLIRRHRLAETLFTRTFQMEEAVVEAEACYFEHILSPAVTDSICLFLGHPPACPHGKAIPPGGCAGHPAKTD